MRERQLQTCQFAGAQKVVCPSRRRRCCLRLSRRNGKRADHLPEALRSVRTICLLRNVLLHEPLAEICHQRLGRTALAERERAYKQAERL